MPSDTSSSSRPRNGGADLTGPQSGPLRNWLRQILGGRAENGWRETIEDLIEEGDGDVDATDHERLLLTNIVRLRELTVYDVMVPRADIVCCDIDTPEEDFLAIVAKRPHSRIPVFRETLDDPAGFVHIKDILARLAAREHFKLEEVLREVPIIAPSMPVLDLLLEMRENRQHMALVVDEFGGIDGLVTIEDVVEQIVGEIEDEHDTDPEPQFVERPDGTMLADARYDIDDFEDKVGRFLDEEEREDIDTLGGLVFALAGRVPARGELLHHPAGFEFEVVEGDPRRVRRLRIRRVPPETVGSDTERDD